MAESQQEEDTVARSLGLDLTRLTAQGANDLPRAFSVLASQDVHARCSWRREGLLAYGPMCRRPATAVDTLLNGMSPGDIPVERATRFELIVNLKDGR